jgi:hypothetical protein
VTPVAPQARLDVVGTHQPWALGDSVLGTLTDVVRLAKPLEEFKQAVERVADDVSDSLDDEQ